MSRKIDHARLNKSRRPSVRIAAEPNTGGSPDPERKRVCKRAKPRQLSLLLWAPYDPTPVLIKKGS